MIDEVDSVSNNQEGHRYNSPWNIAAKFSLTAIRKILDEEFPEREDYAVPSKTWT